MSRLSVNSARLHHELRSKLGYKLHNNFLLLHLVVQPKVAVDHRPRYYAKLPIDIDNTAIDICPYLTMSLVEFWQLKYCM